jgi:hypothetical protein
MGHAKKQRADLFGTDQRITSGPAVKRPRSKAGYMAAPERFAQSQIPLAPRAPSIHGPFLSQSDRLDVRSWRGEFAMVSASLGFGSKMNSAHIRKVIAAGMIGNALEWYDFAIYGYFAVQIGRHFFPHDDAVAQLLRHSACSRSAI